MRARIASTVALLFGLCLAIAPAVAADCDLADEMLDDCEQVAPQPEPESQPQPQPQPEQASAGHVPEAVSRMMVLLNDTRRTHGLPQLSLRGDVSSIARGHSQTMAGAGTIWHNDDYFTAATKRKLDAALLAENVARNTDIDDAHRRLMNSPGHRANILDARLTVVGLGVYRSSAGSLYVTQNFVQPVARAAAKAAAPAAPRAEKARGGAAPAAPAAAAATTTTVAPTPAAPTEQPQVLAAGPDLSLLAGPALPPPGTDERPVGAIAVAAVLALLGVAAVAVHRFRSRFAPFSVRDGR